MSFDIEPPTAPGLKRKKKSFLGFLKKDVDDVRLTKDALDIPSLEPPTPTDSPEPQTAQATPQSETTAPIERGIPDSPITPLIIDDIRPMEEPTEPTPGLVEERFSEPERERLDLEVPALDEPADLPPIDDIAEAEKELAELEREHEETEGQPEETWSDTPATVLEPVAEENDTVMPKAEPTPAAQDPDDWAEHIEVADDNEPSAWAEHPDAQPTGAPSDWTQHEETVEPTTSEWAAHPNAEQPIDDAAWADDAKHTEQPEHHKEVDKALEPIVKKHEKIDKELEKVAQEIRSDIPEWSYQRKEVPPDKYFKLKNGQQIKSFKDLLQALSFIDDETFKHHVTEDKNDFAEWIQHILEEEKLAERVRNKQAREELLKILRTHERKIWKNLEKETKKILDKSKDHTKTTAKLKRMQQNMKQLQDELEAKSKELAELRGKHGKKIKEHVEAHVADRLDAEQTELSLNQDAVKKQEQTLAEREEQLTKREAEVQEREEQLTKEQNALRAEREALDKEKAEAQELIDGAASIRADKEAAEKRAAEVAATLKQDEKTLGEIKKQQGATKRAQETLQQQKQKFEEAKKEFAESKKDITAQERNLKKQLADAEKRATQADEWHAKVLRERKEWADQKKKELAELAAQKKEIEVSVREAKTQRQEYEELVTQNEATMRRNEEILNETERLRDEIQHRQEAMESQSMQEYLRTKVDTTVAGSFTSDSAPPVEEISNLHLYKLIDQCKNALGKNEIGKARHTYNQLREEFGRTKLSSHEKSVLYNSIRELYDDIHLAMLNQ